MSQSELPDFVGGAFRELPSDAGTQQGEARERALITHLGPECFYNHEHHTPPTRLPVLDPSP